MQPSAQDDTRGAGRRGPVWRRRGGRAGSDGRRQIVRENCLMDRGCPAPGWRADARDCRSRQLNTHNTEFREVCYSVAPLVRSYRRRCMRSSPSKGSPCAGVGLEELKVHVNSVETSRAAFVAASSDLRAAAAHSPAARAFWSPARTHTPDESTSARCTRCR